MRAVKCPVSDVTASAAPSQGQLEEELLIYGQCYCNPSTTCCRDAAFHLQTTGSMEKLFPNSYHWALPPPSPPPTRCFCVFVCLSVLSPCWLRCLFLWPPSSSSQTNTNKHTPTQILVFSKSTSSNIDMLLR